MKNFFFFSKVWGIQKHAHHYSFIFERIEINDESDWHLLFLSPNAERLIVLLENDFKQELCKSGEKKTLTPILEHKNGKKDELQV